MVYATVPSGLSRQALLDVLTRLWQVKARSVELLEHWNETATEFDVKAGLGAQLADERRHMRLLADEVKRRGGRAPTVVDHVVSKLFVLAQAQQADLFKVCAFHRGIKAPCHERLQKLLTLADPALRESLDAIVQDEERHLRWADVRLRSLSGEDVRRCNMLLQKMEYVMAAVWSRPWAQVTHSRLSYLADL